MSARLLRYSNEREWIQAQKGSLRDSIDAALREGKSSFHVCLSGGRTPESLYKAIDSDAALKNLAAKIKLHFWVGDERDLLAGDKDRNDTMIRQTLTGILEVSQFHPWPCLEREAACLAYSAELQAELGPQPVFDFTFLGMGADGHTAGIFSSSDAEAPGGPLTHISESPLYPQKRMTISAWVFRKSAKIVVGLRGQDKKQVLEATLGGAILPIGLVTGDRGVFHYLESDRRE